MKNGLMTENCPNIGHVLKMSEYWTNDQNGLMTKKWTNDEEWTNALKCPNIGLMIKMDE